MLDIDDLIRQAQAAKKKWIRPRPGNKRRPPARSWTEILENRTAPKSGDY